MQFLCSTLWIQYSKKSEYKHKVINKQMLLFVNQGGPQHEPTDIIRKSPLTESLHVLHAVHCSCLLINLHITLSWQRFCITQGCQIYLCLFYYSLSNCTSKSKGILGQLIHYLNFGALMNRAFLCKCVGWIVLILFVT